MAEYHLPGMALGVVEDGKVIYTRTAGELVTGGGQPIDADTLFKIASNTKAMTTGLLARLVDAGKLAVGRPGRQTSAAVPDERAVDHARDARARSADPQQRAARRRRRSHAVAGA